MLPGTLAPDGVGARRGLDASRGPPYTTHAKTLVALLVSSLLFGPALPCRAAPPDAQPAATLVDLGPEAVVSRELAVEVARALRQTRHVQFRDLDEELHRGGEEDALALRKAAEGLLRSGAAKLAAGNAGAAADDLDSAVESCEQAYAVLADLTLLARARFLAGVAQFQAGRVAEARARFAGSVESAPRWEPELATYPEALRQAYATVRAAVLARPRVEYEVRTEPPSARVFVNGSFRGLSPLWVKTTAGQQHIALAKQGFARRARLVALNEPVGPIVAELPPAKRKATLDGLLVRLEDVFDGSVEATDLEALQAVAGTGQAVFVRATGDRDQLKLELAWVNLAGRQVLQRLTRSIAWQREDRELITNTVDALFAAPAEVPEAPPPVLAEPTPLWRKWWLWAIVGGVVAGSATAIVLGSQHAGAQAAGYAPGEGGLVIRF